MKIAISGPSCSGKSTLTKMLASKHNMVNLCIDNYWKEGIDRKYRLETVGQTYRIFEFADEYDAEKMVRNTRLISHVIYEGFCIMAFPCVRKIIDWHFYVNVPWDILVKRRESRDGTGTSTIGWKVLGERGNELLTGFQRDLGKTTVLDGNEPTEILVEKISQKMLELSNV